MREIADALNDGVGAEALALIIEAIEIAQQAIVQHERQMNFHSIQNCWYSLSTRQAWPRCAELIVKSSIWQDF